MCHYKTVTDVSGIHRSMSHNVPGVCDVEPAFWLNVLSQFFHGEAKRVFPRAQHIHHVMCCWLVLTENVAEAKEGEGI
jgi:hypothetical protein